MQRYHEKADTKTVALNSCSPHLLKSLHEILMNMFVCFFPPMALHKIQIHKYFFFLLNKLDLKSKAKLECKSGKTKNQRNR